MPFIHPDHIFGKTILEMANLEDFAEKLRTASHSGNPIPPIRFDIGEFNLEKAYAIQEINTLHKMEMGARMIGKKIGLTSLDVQTQLGVDQPDFGVLFDDMEVLNGLFLSVSDVMQGKAEAEIAFVLGEDLDDSRLTIVDVMNAIDYALPAIEIVGSRIEDWNIRIADTIADNASSSHFVLGHTPKTLDEFDMVNLTMKMFANDRPVSEGTGANCMGSPLNATLWLAKKMVEMDQPLQAGEIILSGALGPMHNLKAGERLYADFGVLGNVSLYITD